MNKQPEIISLESLNRLSFDDKKKYLKEYHGWLVRQRKQDKKEMEFIRDRKYRFKVAKRKILTQKSIWIGNYLMCYLRVVVTNKGGIAEYFNLYDWDEKQIEKRKEYDKRYYHDKVKRK